MADPYMGEIRMFAGSYAPEHWSYCDGQLIAVSQFQALYSVMGTQYGGDGRTTFGLPNLKDRVPMGNGSGPGLTPRTMGQYGGSIFETLTTSQIPAHSHDLYANEETADLADPLASLPAKGLGRSIGTFKLPLNLYNQDPRPLNMSTETVHPAGGSQGHVNVQPYLCVIFIICMVGVYPPRQ